MGPACNGGGRGHAKLKSASVEALDNDTLFDCAAKAEVTIVKPGCAADRLEP